VGIGYGIEAATQETVCVSDTSEYNLGDFCATGNSTLGVTALMLSVVIGLAYLVWNYGYKQGTTGSSIGKGIMKFKVVSEATGQPIGFGMSIVRQLAHHRRIDLLHRLPVPAVGCQASDDRRQTPQDGLPASLTPPARRLSAPRGQAAYSLGTVEMNRLAREEKS
jgi:hypothetical protein